jgi:pre-mRNA-processing factor SLU7
MDSMIISCHIIGEWKSREVYKKEKELEEARKAGTVAPEQDEEGRDINPHIPQYIRNAPCTLTSYYM